jgi:class 3 adenylate cyclase
LRAERSYGEAIRLAARHGVLADEGLANELAGEFELERGRSIAGCAHLVEARKAYTHWGSKACVDWLARRHPELLSLPEQEPNKTLRLGETRGLIDIAAITRAAAAISGKILVEEVVSEVIQASVMSAGATRAMLLLLEHGEFVIRAEANGDGQGGAIAPIAFAGSSRGPERLVNFVARARESVVLGDATRDDAYGDDPFIIAHRPHSLLCMPLVDRGKLVGVLYAENGLSRSAFTEDRIRTLEMLASQAVISLENARLYQEARTHAATLEIKVQERTQELEQAYGSLRQIFGKYVPRRVAETIVSNRGLLRPTETVATILFSDIQGFTGIVERMAPERLIEMLNEYFSAVIEPIDRNDGIVNQFLGDAMLVTFNIPIADPEHAEKALRTAIAIQRVVQGRKFAGVELVTRIGIHTGTIIAGNVGSGDRVNYAVYGDAVNLAARIEQLNKKFGSLVLVSGTTVEQVTDTHGLEPVGETIVRGKTQPVKLYRLAADASRSASNARAESNPAELRRGKN